jgi:hypothetical protein
MAPGTAHLSDRERRWAQTGAGLKLLWVASVWLVLWIPLAIYCVSAIAIGFTTRWLGRAFGLTPRSAIASFPRNTPLAPPT